MMISNRKHPLVFMGYTELIQRLKDEGLTISSPHLSLSSSSSTNRDRDFY